MVDIFSVENKVVVITGSSRGIGKNISEWFEAHKAKVCLISRSFENKEENENHDFYHCDITNYDLIKKIVEKIVIKHGRIDTLINNAGISLSTEDPYDFDVWNKTLEVNLSAIFNLSKLVVEQMKLNNKGSIINISSIGSGLAFPYNPSYQVSKAGLNQLTRAMAYDFGKYNIRFNTICPGYFMTDMTKNSYNDPQLKEERSKRTMLNRWGHPDELIGACIFLASDASSYMTASCIYVDGGWTAKGL